MVAGMIDATGADRPERMQNGSTQRTRYSNFDAATEARDGKLTVSPLRGGPFLLEAVTLGLGNIAVRIGRHSPLLAHGALAANTVWAAFPISRNERFCR
jgi:hypothetical protein